MKTIKYSVVILGVIAAIGIGAYFYIQNEFADGDELTKIAEEINERETPLPFANEEEVELDMTETEVQIYIHHMTHQHVEAQPKWGEVVTTPQNIENLLTIVQANQDAYEYSDFYIDVLEKWEQGDFSNSVEVHNTIWNWHGGTIGRATSLLK